MPEPHLPTRLIQIVPRFRPDVDGLGECALVLGDTLHRLHGIPSDFVVYNRPRPSAELPLPTGSAFPHTVTHATGEGFAAMREALLQVVARQSTLSSVPPSLLLHYTSYGYNGQGLPIWMPGLLREFTRNGGRLLGFFHELYAVGNFPSRVFFTSWLQQRIFRQLFTLSRVAIVSSEQSVERIQRAAKRHPKLRSCPVRLVGICSNIGEVDNPLPLAQRSPRLVIFGQYLTRRRIYERYLNQLQAICQRHGITEIADIGPVPDEPWMRQHAIEPLGSLLRVYGPLPTEQASALLADSRIGAVLYDYPRRWKSGIFGAYQAHGQAILLFPYNFEHVELDPGDWCFSPEAMLALEANEISTEGRLQHGATAGHRHYQQYRSSSSIVDSFLPFMSSAAEPHA